MKDDRETRIRVESGILSEYLDMKYDIERHTGFALQRIAKKGCHEERDRKENGPAAGMRQDTGFVWKIQPPIDPGGLHAPGSQKYLEVALESCIFIGERIIAAQGLRKPDTYKEVIEIVGEQGILPVPFAARFAEAVNLRNILVRRYRHRNSIRHPAEQPRRLQRVCPVYCGVSGNG